MRKLSMLAGLLAIVASCQESPNLSEFEESEALARMTEEEQSTFLLSSSTFEPVYRDAVNRLYQSRDQIAGGVSVETLPTANGMLVIQSEEQFRPVYEQVVLADSVWNNQYEQEIAQLVQLVQNDQELSAGFADEDEISWAIEDLLEDDQVDQEDVMQNVSDRMPINTLWNKVKQESDLWLASMEGVENPNWDEYPENQIAVGPYGRMFVNDAALVQVQDSVIVAEGIVSFGKGDEYLQGRVDGNSGCRTFRVRTAYNNSASRLLRVRCYVNNFWLWKSFGVSCKGWKMRRRRWRARRFSKTLSRGGLVVIHSASLEDPCDPVFARNVGWTRTRSNVSFRIQNTFWGPSVYVGACRFQYAGVVSGGGVSVGVVMN